MSLVIARMHNTLNNSELYYTSTLSIFIIGMGLNMLFVLGKNPVSFYYFSTFISVFATNDAFVLVIFFNTLKFVSKICSFEYNLSFTSIISTIDNASYTFEFIVIAF